MRSRLPVLARTCPWIRSSTRWKSSSSSTSWPGRRRGRPVGNRGDGEGAIHALDTAPDEGRVCLGRSRSCACGCWTGLRSSSPHRGWSETKARARLEALRPRLCWPLRVRVDVAEYGRVLAETAAWIDEKAPGSVGVGDAARQVRVRAIMTVFGMASGLYQQLRDRCVDVVAGIAAVPAPPAGVWQLQTSGDAETAMVRAGRETDWANLVRLSDEWDSCHAAASCSARPGSFRASWRSTVRLICAPCF